MSNATTPRKPRQPKAKPQRFCRLVTDPDTLETTLVIRQVAASGKETVDAYALEDVGSHDGRGFSLTKPDGTVYHVEATAAGRSCDCKGFTRWGHCKHCEALAALAEKGRLSPVCEPAAA